MVVESSYFFQNMDAVSVLQKSFLLQIPSGLIHIIRPAEITPIILIGAKSEDVFSFGCEA